MTTTRKASVWLVLLAILGLGSWGWCALADIGDFQQLPPLAIKPLHAPTSAAQFDTEEMMKDVAFQSSEPEAQARVTSNPSLALRAQELITGPLPRPIESPPLPES